MLYSLWSLLYIFSPTRVYTKQIIILLLYILMMYLYNQSFILWYYTGLSRILSLGHGLWNYCLTSQKKEWQGSATLAALYPTVRLSPWRQIQKNIHSRVCGPPVPPDLYPLRRATLPGSPWFLVTRGYGPHPRRLIRTPAQGG